MKTLVILGVAQTALILVLLLKVIALDKRAEPGLTPAWNPAPVNTEAESKEGSPTFESADVLDEGRLRTIVREELAALLNNFFNSAPQSTAVKGPEAVSATEYQYRLSAAMQNLEYYIRQGKISDSDMVKFQSEIARLDDQGRRQMLSELAQALSSGQLEGHF